MQLNKKVFEQKKNESKKKEMQKKRNWKKNVTQPKKISKIRKPEYTSRCIIQTEDVY